MRTPIIPALISFHSRLLVALIFVLPVLSVGQDRIYMPFKRITNDSSFIESLDFRLKSENDSLKYLEKKQFNTVAGILKDRNNYLKENLKAGYYFLGSPLQVTVDRIVKEIISNNRNISSGINVVLSDYRYPNAFSLGSGIIIINLGLLSRIENEAQLAFVICHELAHDQLQHVSKKIIKKAELEHDAELTKSIKKIATNEYNKFNKLKDLLLPEMLSLTSWGRQHEIQADSLGLIYYLNTSYPASEVPLTLLKLDEFNHEKKTENFDLPVIFGCREFPFLNDWNNYKTASSLGKFEAEKDSILDSLKTHPDCKLRSIIVSQKLSGVTEKISEKNRDSLDFRKTHYAASAEMIHTASLEGEFSRAIYLALEMLSDYKNDPYAEMMIARNLALLYISSIRHSTNTALAKTSAYHDENYNRLLYFLNEIRPSEIAALSQCNFNKRPASSIVPNEEYDFTALLVSYAGSLKQKFEESKTAFVKDYPESIYKDYINNLNIKQ